MKELVILLAGLMPEKELIAKLEEEIAKYKGNPTKDQFLHLATWCSLILSRASMNSQKGDSSEKMIKAMEEMNKVEAAQKLLKTETN